MEAEEELDQQLDTIADGGENWRLAILANWKVESEVKMAENAAKMVEREAIMAGREARREECDARREESEAKMEA